MKFRSLVPAFCATLLCAVPLLADPAAKSAPNAPANEAVLARYQLALDQLSAGNLSTARVVLESGIRQFGPQADLNLLLGYILQREGNSAAALKHLAQTPASSLATAFANQLNSTETRSTAVQGATPRATQNDTQFVPIAVAAAPVIPALPNIALPQTDARLARLEAEMVELVNAERAKAGLKPLAIHEKLATVSRAHAAEMRDKNYFAHESPTAGLREPMDRYQSVFNDRPRIIAENIFRSWGAQRLITIHEVKEGHAALMKSPGHRANILYADVTHIGIGIVGNSRGDLWITQMFLRP